MSFGILYEAYSKGDAFYGYEHEKGASHWKTRQTFSLDLFTMFLYGMISKFDEYKKGKSNIFKYFIPSEFIFYN